MNFIVSMKGSILYVLMVCLYSVYHMLLVRLVIYIIWVNYYVDEKSAKFDRSHLNQFMDHIRFITHETTITEEETIFLLQE